MGALALLLLTGSLAAQVPPGGSPWARHTIDAGSKGADGVRFADVDRDGLTDIVTGWEEGGAVRVAFQPPLSGIRDPWPTVEVGRVGSPEDAVAVDLDADGALEIVSSSEGRTRSVHVHRVSGPARDPASWSTAPFPALEGRAAWMFCAPARIGTGPRPDLFLGSKNEGAGIGVLTAPPQPRDLSAWRWRSLRPAGWVMSLVPADLDADGDLDLLFSDRKGPRRGVAWLENPGRPPDPGSPWPEHAIGGADAEVMFLDYADLDGDARLDVVAATRDRGLLVFRRSTDPGAAWAPDRIAAPPGLGKPKAVAIADLDGDTRADLVVSCEGAERASGVLALMASGDRERPTWIARDISGPPGTKFDLVVPYDLDRDGDLDVVTCEEAENLGVVWYENPGR